MATVWRKLLVNKPGVRLDLTLQSGQSFRWKETAPGEWTSVICGFVWILKQLEQGEILYRVYESSNGPHSSRGKRVLEEVQISSESEKDKGSKIYESILRDYFQVDDVDVEILFDQWKTSDPHFSKVSDGFRGVRVLRQDPVENLFSFICSSNNNIPRISGMVEKLCQAYGQKLGELHGVTYYTFPCLKDLTGAKVEENLRKMGFGYRAKFISQSACFILKHHDSGWLEKLRSVSYEEAHAALCELPGVGAKVADCVCLMSLDKTEAVPVDTHVWQLTTKHYMPHLQKTKSLTTKMYKEIGDHYRFLFGKYAGWAQSVLFTSHLKKFETENLDIKRKKQSKSNKRSVETESNSMSSPQPSIAKKRKCCK